MIDCASSEEEGKYYVACKQGKERKGKGGGLGRRVNVGRVGVG